MLSLCRLSSGYNSGMTEYIHFELSENDKGDDQKGNICNLPLLHPHYSIYNIEQKFELKQKHCVHVHNDLKN